MRDMDLGDLSFNPEEQELLRRMERPAEPVRAGHLPRWVLGVLAAIFVLCLMSVIPKEEPVQASAKPIAIGITKTALNIRSGPSITTDSLTVLPKGTPVEITQSRSDGFYGVAHGNVSGYAASAYLATTSGVTIITSTHCRISDITGRARVHESPALQAPTTFALEAASPLVIIGFTQNGWALITSQNRAGFVWGGLLQQCAPLPFQRRREGDLRVVVYNGQALRPS